MDIIYTQVEERQLGHAYEMVLVDIFKVVII
jgi:hypothetical protein